MQRRLEQCERLAAASPTGLAAEMSFLGDLVEESIRLIDACTDEAAQEAVLAADPFTHDDVDRLIAVYEFMVGPPRRPHSEIPPEDAAFVHSLYLRCRRAAS